MANYVCQPLNPQIKSDLLGEIKVATDGLHAGQIIVADTLDTTIVGNYKTFYEGSITANNLNSNHFALVLNDQFETLADGRRPSGNPNYYTYTYRAGQVVPILWLENRSMINIGYDSIDQTTRSLAIVGNYLVPVANSNLLNAVASIPAGTSTALKIIGTKNTAIGGNYGGGFTTTMICVSMHEEIDSGNLIYSFTVDNQVYGTTIVGNNITVNIPKNASKTNLVANFEVSRDASVKVNGVTQVSGVTANDYTSPVSFVVTSQDGTSRTYTVTCANAGVLTLTKTNATAEVTNQYGDIMISGSPIIQGLVLKINATQDEGFEFVGIYIDGSKIDGDIYTTTNNNDISIDIQGGNENIQQDGDVLIINSTRNAFSYDGVNGIISFS